MPDTFHYFGKLPRELRDEIWRLAIGPTRPGVHVFPLHDPEQGDKDVETPKRETWTAVLRRHYEFRKIDLRVGCSYRGKTAVVGGDDEGIWTACSESRLMMQKYTKGPLETYFYNNWTAYLTSMLPPANFFYLVPILHELDTIIKNRGHHSLAFDSIVDYGSMKVVW
ncbi:hypothetical protein FSARC_9567 [Fusarium sarcochroum]|uniref:2EXR domain-containing protein n=1 Tax=Fusarium sarcochroum TaxID=1208366 RepID=A0A8H4X610_9HYPO|nr:hypothetical protein FSARC_9567 [Fusarium sarcochroum]